MKYIFLTGHGSEEDFRAGSVEASHYLVKPLDIESLIDTMRQAVESMKTDADWEAIALEEIRFFGDGVGHHQP